MIDDMIGVYFMLSRIRKRKNINGFLKEDNLFGRIIVMDYGVSRTVYYKLHLCGGICQNADLSLL
jgi:hypothetical protein